MRLFELNSDIIYAIDVKGISVVYQKELTHIFIQYPEAAVWSVLIENYGKSKSIQMLKSILGKNQTDTERYIRQCIENWKQLNIIL